MRSCTLVVAIVLLAGLPDYLAAQQRTDNVVIAPVSETGSSGAITTRQQLDEQIRRYADRYISRMSNAVEWMRRFPLDPEQYEWVQNWETMSSKTAVDIAIGSNAVTNLLDMMVLTTLGRMVTEQYWVPERFGKEYGQPLLTATRALEKDIWEVADSILTSDQQSEMLIMIQNYRNEHPDQVNPWWIRMNQFSGQRAARLGAIKRSGGMLKEVRRARETAEEIQELAERALFYIQRAPGIAFNTMETSTLQMLSGPRASEIFAEFVLFNKALGRLEELLKALPREQFDAVEQAMDGLDRQRVAFLNDFTTISPEVRPMLDNLRAIVETTERITAMLDTDKEPSEPVDIAEYRALTADVTQATIELTKLVDAVSGVTENPVDIVTAVDHIAAGQERVLNRLLVILLISIAFFFVCLLGYRFVAVKVGGL